MPGTTAAVDLPLFQSSLPLALLLGSANIQLLVLHLLAVQGRDSSLSRVCVLKVDKPKASRCIVIVLQTGY